MMGRGSRLHWFVYACSLGHSLFSFPLGVVGRLCSVIVVLSRNLYFFE